MLQKHLCRKIILFLHQSSAFLIVSFRLFSLPVYVDCDERGTNHLQRSKNTHIILTKDLLHFHHQAWNVASKSSSAVLWICNHKRCKQQQEVFCVGVKRQRLCISALKLLSHLIYYSRKKKSTKTKL